LETASLYQAGLGTNLDSKVAATALHLQVRRFLAVCKAKTTDKVANAIKKVPVSGASLAGSGSGPPPKASVIDTFRSNGWLTSHIA
jgi:hypothetical protein